MYLGTQEVTFRPINLALPIVEGEKKKKKFPGSLFPPPPLCTRLHTSRLKFSPGHSMSLKNALVDRGDIIPRGSHSKKSRAPLWAWAIFFIIVYSAPSSGLFPGGPTQEVDYIPHCGNAGGREPGFINDPCFGFSDNDPACGAYPLPFSLPLKKKKKHCLGSKKQTFTTIVKREFLVRAGVPSCVVDYGPWSHCCFMGAL